MLTNPSLWPPLGRLASSAKEDDRDSASGKWVDKVMVNKHDNIRKDPNPSASREVGSGQLPEKFNQSYIRGPTKIYPEQNLNKLTTNKKGNQDSDQQQIRSEVGSTDGSDHEAATSDCSETDSVWQSNIPKITNVPNGLASKSKKQQLRTAKSTEFR